MDGRLRSPWYDGECARRANEREVSQMLDIDYTGSAYQFFDKGTILRLQGECVSPYWEGEIAFDELTGEPVDLVKVAGGPVKLWCRLDPDGRPPWSLYGAGCDVSTGSGATPSVLSIGDARTGEKVLEYATAFLRPEQFATRAVAICRLFRGEMFSGARLAWEIPGPGLTFGKRVLELGYQNVYFRETNLALSGSKQSDRPGWTNTNETKRNLLEEYRAALSTRVFVNRSRGALEECTFFEEVDGGRVEFKGAEANYDPETGKLDPNAAGVNHGDKVIADALCFKMLRSLGLGSPAAVATLEPQLGPGSLWGRRQMAREQKSQGAWI
jgi:hypothetical protein